jgi:hypothetical protein
VASDRRDDKPMSRTPSFLLQIAIEKSYAHKGELGLMGPLLGCVGYLLCLSTASAAEATLTPMSPIPVVQIFTFLFLMLGPIKIIGPFAKSLRGPSPG